MKRALVAPGLAPAAGRIAQLVEQLTLNQRVQGSSPCAPTNEINELGCFLVLMWDCCFLCGPHEDPVKLAAKLFATTKNT